MTLEELEKLSIELPCKECIMKCKCGVLLHKEFKIYPGIIINNASHTCSILESYIDSYKCEYYDNHLHSYEPGIMPLIHIAYTICKEFGLEFIKWLEINARMNYIIRDVLYLYNKKYKKHTSHVI